MQNIIENFSKNAKFDIKSGFLISLIALPLCLGIALASGFPAISGVTTAIIGGFFASFIGSSNLTIKGPAAGLITIIIGCVIELGGSDMLLGYQRTLAVGAVAAVIQIILSFLRVANLGFSIPRSVINGMMASIGIIIITKQIHIMFGQNVKAISIFDSMSQIPASILNNNPLLTLIGLLSFGLIIIWPKIRLKITKFIPSQILILIFTIIISLSLGFNHNFSYEFFSKSYEISSQHLVSLPNSFISSFVFPDFSQIFSTTSIRYIIMLSLIGTIESTLTVVAVDNIDPEKRTSNLNKDLFSLGFANLISSLIGGLPMISEVVRSKANIDNGAKSSLSNFFHGLFLLCFVALIPNLLNLIPLSALAAMLVFVGFRLMQIEKIKYISKVGYDQYITFLTTIIMTLSFDLLIGVLSGVIIKIILHLLRSITLRALFSPKIDLIIENNTAIFKFHNSAAFSSLTKFHEILNNLDDNIDKIIIDLNDVKLVDNSFLSDFRDTLNNKDKIKFEFLGLEKLTKDSNHYLKK